MSLKDRLSEKIKKFKIKMPSIQKPKIKFKKPKIVIKKEKRYRTDVASIFQEYKSKSEIQENSRYAFMGIGNDLKGDDGIGWYVIDKLKSEFGNDKNLLFIKTSVPEDHVKEIREFAPKLLIIIDAADFGKSPGDIKVIKEYQINSSALSSHTSPITLFLRLYQKNEPHKKAVTIIGIQKGVNEFGQPIGTTVRKSGDNISKTISELCIKGFLSISLEKELEKMSSPVKKIINYFKSG